MTTTTYTAEALSAMTLADLTVVYNTFAPRSIKKFSCSKATAVEQTLLVQSNFVPPAPVKAKPAKKATTEAATTSTKKPGIGAFIKAQLKAGVAPADILTAVQAEFEGAATSMKCIYWYKCDMKAKGEL